MSTSVVFAYLFGMFDHDMTNAIGKGNLVAMHNDLDRMSGPCDVSLAHHGNALACPSFMFRQIDRIKGVDLVMFEAAEWWTHQDVYVLQQS